MKYPHIFRTLCFNIGAFGLWKGLRLPVYVYGRMKVHSYGKIDIQCPIRRGLIKIGMNSEDTAFPYTQFNNKGRLEIHGRTWLHHGCRLRNEGTIVFGGSVIISNACTFDIRERLEFGHDISVGYGSEFTDSDVHYTVDVETRDVQKNTRPIRIGNFNWFGSHTYVKKGTITPDYLMVASPNAVLLKDYSSIEPYTILGGHPAHPIAKGKRRILKFSNEQKIREELKRKECVHLPENVDLDEFCRL